MATNNPNGSNPEAAATRAAQQVAELLRSHLQNLEAQSEAELHVAAQERAVADAQFTEVCFRNESFSQTHSCSPDQRIELFSLPTFRMKVPCEKLGRC